jgi:hypothetical protein
LGKGRGWKMAASGQQGRLSGSIAMLAQVARTSGCDCSVNIPVDGPTELALRPSDQEHSRSSPRVPPAARSVTCRVARMQKRTPRPLTLKPPASCSSFCGRPTLSAPRGPGSALNAASATAAFENTSSSCPGPDPASTAAGGGAPALPRAWMMGSWGEAREAGIEWTSSFTRSLFGACG